LADGVWQERDGHVQFYRAEPAGTIRVQQCWPAHLWCDPLHDAVLRITKVLTKRGWQDREDDPFAEEEPGWSASHQRCAMNTWRAALLGKPIDPATEQRSRAGLNKLPKPDGRNCAR